jgi:alkanesulfonate monooxygenase SsuD/methylene tetrahydromethanopterin reductase-like flavin-dependent oxidoreductase (luciferase family)
VHDPRVLGTNLMFGTPDEVIARLRAYDWPGVDEFTCHASPGRGHKEQQRSLALFCKEVIPAFKCAPPAYHAGWRQAAMAPARRSD